MQPELAQGRFSASDRAHPRKIPARRNCLISAPAASRRPLRRRRAAPAPRRRFPRPPESRESRRRSTTAPEVSPPATTSRRTPGLDQPFRDVGHRLLDGMAGGVAAVTRLQGRDLIRRRTGGDQDRALPEPLSGPGERAPGLILARDNLIGIEMQHRHVSFGVRDLLQASPASNCRQGTPPVRRPGLRRSRSAHSM